MLCVGMLCVQGAADVSAGTGEPEGHPEQAAGESKEQVGGQHLGLGWEGQLGCNMQREMGREFSIGSNGCCPGAIHIKQCASTLP